MDKTPLSEHFVELIRGWMGLGLVEKIVSLIPVWFILWMLITGGDPS